ncbi:hypothetical protein TKK_0002333 [Trichogramma kaykai]
MICQNPRLGAVPTFSFRTATLPNVVEALRKCRLSSSGPDSIPAKAVKLASSSIHDCIALLANSSFETGIFPLAWKTPNIVSNFITIDLFEEVDKNEMYSILDEFLDEPSNDIQDNPSTSIIEELSYEPPSEKMKDYQV